MAARAAGSDSPRAYFAPHNVERTVNRLAQLALGLRFLRVNGVPCRDFGAIRPSLGRFSQRNGDGNGNALEVMIAEVVSSRRDPRAWIPRNNDRSQVKNAIAGGGLLRLEPSWVPRSFMIPGQRLKLHPDDLYALGGHRGGINERWFSSTTNADNGPGTPADEGLSYVRLDDGSRFLLKDAVETGRRSAARLGGDGAREGLEPALQVLRQHGADPASHAPERRAGEAARPQGQARGVLLPAAVQQDRQQLSRTRSWASSPGTTKADVRRCLENWNKGDNGILFLSRAFRLEPGTGWQIDPGILHAPGSLVTYEPQVDSDVFAMFQSEVEGRITPLGAADEGRPAGVSPRSRLSRRAARLGRERQPDLRGRQPLFPKPVKPFARPSPRATASSGSPTARGWYSAKELTVLPKRTVTIKDAAPTASS